MAGVRYVAKKLARAFNPMFSIISLTESSLVAMARSSVFREFGTSMLLLVLYLSCTCPVLVLFVPLFGGINQHVAVRSSFMKNKAVARVLPSQKGLFWGVMQ